jgi:hypothetical protein
LLCFIVVPPYALRSSGLTNLILIVAVELYLKGLLPAILATAFRVRAQSSCSFALMQRHGQSSSAEGTYQRNDTNCCPAGDDGYPPKGEVAGLKNVWVAVDPEQTIMIGPCERAVRARKRSSAEGVDCGKAVVFVPRRDLRRRLSHEKVNWAGPNQGADLSLSREVE